MTVKARKMVLVSWGALGSPLVLERSAVGSRDILKEASVSVAADVPGVGTNYQDHNLMCWPSKTNLGSPDTLDALRSGRMTPEEAVANSLMQYSRCDMHIKYRPSEEEVKELASEFEEHWKAEYCDLPSKALLIMTSVGAGPDWEDQTSFETGFFTQDVHIKKQIYGYRVFPAGSEAALVDLNAPLAEYGKPLNKIKYTADDDKAIDHFLRKDIGTTWHSMGTCAMKPWNQGGVVDKKLNVYGTQGLKVVDLSIWAENVGANTQITAYTIGEKGMEIIMRELGLAGAKQEGGRLNGHAH
ncbi:hypothetical protein B0A55_01469 [Friedmanniomyces simplex]|uniref:Glucose-methanol-choline oxidoreductase N-terminal domain-containing protein n=1 Tax=Friedmanniomyces simplex TaxID=329884 RepID=A0A4U0Y3F9_9PEZI|nr:hypothetical protein B0A55_01469 [Friedmanniomyces simplex]